MQYLYTVEVIRDEPYYERVTVTVRAACSEDAFRKAFLYGELAHEFEADEMRIVSKIEG